MFTRGFRYLVLIIFCALLLVGCSLPILGSVEKTVYIAPNMVECEGEGPQMCLLVREDPEDEYTYFYDQIEGFDYQEGYEYEILVREETVEEPPAGGSSVRWVLVEEVNRTPVEGAQAVPVLEGEFWVLDSYRSDSGDLDNVLPGTEITAGFKDGQIDGNAGCNNYFASYQLDEGMMTVSEIGMTEMFCVDPDNIMEQEIAYLNALGNAGSYQLEGGRLFITDRNGVLVLIYNRYEPFELTGTVWNLAFYNNGEGGFVSVIDGTEVNATFSDDGTLSGVAGCNDYMANYQVDGESIDISQPALTRKACEEALMDQESAFIAALETAASYKIELNSLTMDNEDGVRVLNFVGEKIAEGITTPSPAATEPEVTPTIQPTATKVITPTATPTQEATSTPLPTPTEIETETPGPTITPTPTALPNLVFEDDFTLDTGWVQYQWDTHSFQLKDGAYNITVNTPNGFVYSTRSIDPADVILETDAQFQGGSDQNYFGMVCRFEGAVNYYVFLVNGSGAYAIGKVEDGMLEMLKQDANQSGLVKLGDQVNRLRGDCIGDTLSLYINGEKLLEVQDDTFQEGTSGLVALTTYSEPQLLVRFDYFAVYTP